MWPKEQRRLQRGLLLSRRHDAPADRTIPWRRFKESDLQKLLDQGDREIALQHAPEAEAIFQNVLKQDPNQPRAIYGLAIASVLEGKALVAKDCSRRWYRFRATPGAGPGQGTAETSRCNAVGLVSHLSWPDP